VFKHCLNQDLAKKAMNRKSEEKNVRKLAKSGKVSLAVTLPREMVLALGWREKQKVVVKKHGQELVISDWKE
jgi:antitoxin component of MazEF toxin-antitoxin module